jgi:hypothetical protein
VNPARGMMRFDAMANASMAKSVAAAMALAALLHLLASAIAIFAIRRRG